MCSDVRNITPPGTMIRIAALTIRNGQVVIFDSGTTAFLIAQYLPIDLKAIIITNSPPIASVLTKHPQIEVIVLGGVAPYIVGKIDELTHIITDASVSKQLLAPYEAAGLIILQG